jgi:hypothetical protein
MRELLPIAVLLPLLSTATLLASWRFSVFVIY